MKRVCHTNEINNGSAKGFKLEQHSLFVIKNNHNIFIYQNSCPHLGLELNWQPDQFLDSDGLLIQCATHGALFLIESGKCVSGPCIGKNLTPINYNIINDQIFIDT